MGPLPCCFRPAGGPVSAYHFPAAVAMVGRGGMQLLILVPGGGCITVQAVADEDIYTLKVKIWVKQGVPTQQQLLTFAGRQLQDSCMLRDYGIREGSSVRLLYRLHGGLRPRPPSPLAAAARAAAAAVAAAGASRTAAETLAMFTAGVADRRPLWEVDGAVAVAETAAAAAAGFAQLAQAAAETATASWSARAVADAAEAMVDAEIEAAAARRTERVVASWAAEWWGAAGGVVPPLRWA